MIKGISKRVGSTAFAIAVLIMMSPTFALAAEEGGRDGGTA
jgi:hypothetical protein